MVNEQYLKASELKEKLLQELSEVSFIPNPPNEEFFKSVFNKVLVHSLDWDEFCDKFPAKKIRQHYLTVQYLFSNYYIGYEKNSKEIIWLQSLVGSLDKKKRELVEKNKQLEVKLEEKNDRIEELEERVEELDDEVWMEWEESEKALNKAMEWRKWQMFETVLKHDAAMGKHQDRIDLLENNLLAKDQKINWRDYLESKELPALPKQQKENRLHRLKKLVSRVKEKTKKFQTFIVQKSK